MAQTGYTPILIYSSSTASQSPAVANLTNSTLGSELAINITDGKLFYKDNANAIQVIGWKVVPATAGGTGQTSYAVGDLLYANTTTSLAKLADVATGNALISGGVNVAPSWGKIGLTTHVSGVLPTANGGTNLSSFTANGVFYATSTSVIGQSSNMTFDGNNFTISGELISTTNNARISLYRSAGTNYFDWASGQTLAFGTQTSQGGAGRVNKVNFYDNGDIGNATGNYVPATAAKGINFTANTPAAGMTSQLLNWYEHGTWTPVLEAENGAFGAISYNALNGGRYVRVGNMVHVQALFYTDSVAAGTASLEIRLAGLPFTAVASTGSTQDGFSSLAISQSSGWVVNQPSGAFVRANSKQINLTYRSLANGGTATMNVNEVTTGSTGNLVRFAGTYFCA